MPYRDKRVLISEAAGLVAYIEKHRLFDDESDVIQLFCTIYDSATDHRLLRQIIAYCEGVISGGSVVRN